MNLRGKVKSIHDTVQFPLEDSVEKVIDIHGSDIDDELYNFNETGNITVHIIKSKHLSITDLYLYNKAGNLISKLEYRCRDSSKRADRYGETQPNLKDTVKTFYTYNEKGKISEALEYKNSKKLIRIKDTSRTIYTYDGKGNLLSELVYGNKYKPIDSTIYKYNRKGQLVYKLHPYFMAGFVSKWRYEYDSIARTICEKAYNEKDTFLGKTTSTCDSLGNIIESEELDWQGNYKKWNYEYDARDSVLKMCMYSKNKLLLANLYQYDTFGNEIEFTQISDLATEIHKSQYLFDIHNNWIERKNYYSDFEPHGSIPNQNRLIEYRKIEYYK